MPNVSMWEPFTERARRVVVLAQEEAQRLGMIYLGTEHVFLGILAEGENIAAKTMAISLTQGRAAVEHILGMNERQKHSKQSEMVFTPRAKRLYELAFEAARLTNCNYVGTEHLLLGLIREGEGVGYRALKNIVGDTDALADKVIAAMKNEPPPAPDRYAALRDTCNVFFGGERGKKMADVLIATFGERS